MGLKILRVCAVTPYQALFSENYFRHNLQQSSYENALKHFQDKGFLIPGSWTKCMSELGHFAIDIAPDFLLLQAKWAEENKISTVDFQQIFFSQINAFKPDVIYFERGGFTTISSSIRKEIKTRFPFVKIVTGLWGDALPRGWTWRDFSDLDLLFCTYTILKKQFNSHGIKSYLSYLCFDDCLIQLPAKEQEVNFTFAGTTGYGFGDHKGRYFDLLNLVKYTELEIWTNEPKFKKKFLKRVIQNKIINKLSFWIENIKSLSKKIPPFLYESIAYELENEKLKWRNFNSLADAYPHKCHSALFGVDYFRLLKSSKIVFNRHRDEKEEYGNIRMFEATGIGACLLTDRGEEAAHLFEADKEIVTYRSIGEAIEKYRYLIEHDAVRQEIASAGQRRTLRDHTIKNRCQLISEKLLESI